MTHSPTKTDPSLVGFSYDGFYIYGRYLSSDAPGFQNPSLDICGGHEHAVAGTDEYGNDLTRYHYHTQVFDDYCSTSSGLNYYKCNADVLYAASTTGPYQCWRGAANVTSSSISKIVQGTSSVRSKPCCQMSEYYLLTGVQVADSNYVSTTCTRPSDPDNGSYDTTACPETLYSGYVCDLTCASGYVASGTLQCLGGSFASEPSCVEDGSTATTATPSEDDSTTTTTSSPSEDDSTTTTTSSPSEDESTTTTASSSDNESSSSSSDDSSSDTMIYAIIGGACAGVIVLVAGGYCFMRSRMSKKGGSTAPRT